MKKIYFLLFFVMLFLSACTAHPNDLVNTVSVDGVVAGFWLGLWHGIIAPFSFIASLFFNEMSLYEVHNNGNWYNLGFVLGAGILCGSGVSGSQKVSSSRDRSRNARQNRRSAE